MAAPGRQRATRTGSVRKLHAASGEAFTTKDFEISIAMDSGPSRHQVPRSKRGDLFPLVFGQGLVPLPGRRRRRGAAEIGLPVAALSPARRVGADSYDMCQAA